MAGHRVTLLDLPQEILHEIFSYIPNRKGMRAGQRARVPSCAALAATCRSFQYIIEQHLFKTLKLSSSEFDVFATTMSHMGGRRRGHLRRLEYIITWSFPESIYGPEGDLDDMDKLRPLLPASFHNNSFSERVDQIITELSEWSNLAVEHLVLGIDHPKNRIEMDEERSNPPAKKLEPFVRLTDEFETKTLRSVKTFDLFADEADLYPEAVWQIAQCCPSLQSLGARVEDERRRKSPDRVDARLSLVKHLCDLPSTVRDAGLVFEYQTATNHALTPPDLCASSKSVDLFSMHLRQFSHRLERLELTAGQISAELFWPQNKEDESSHLSWPALKSLTLTTQGDTADGQWMIERDPTWPRRESFAERDESGDEEGGPGREFGWHETRSFRQKPRQDWFDHFNLAVAHAAERMPQLENMVIRVDQRHCDERYGAHTFSYKSGGAGEAKTNTGNPRVEWAGESRYEPAEEIQALWRAIVGQSLELDIVAYYNGPRKVKPGDLHGWVRFRNGQRVEYDDRIDV